MRVLVVHNRYQLSGGEDAVYESEVELLRSRGIEVDTLEFDNKIIPERPSLLQRSDLALATIWSRHGHHAIKQKLMAFRPMVVHFHNTFPLISPSAYYAAKEQGVRVVQTLHNFRMACVNGLLFREGSACERCLGKPPVSAIRHACYRGSRTASAAVAGMQVYHRLTGTWTQQVDSYIALTNFAKRKFVTHGLPEEKILIKPNFAKDEGVGLTSGRVRLLYVGRLSEEKGVRLLADALVSMGDSAAIDILGDGPLHDFLARRIKRLPGVVLHGAVDSSEVIRCMKRARALVVPSICYEGFPRTIVEAYSVGTPVVATPIGALAEIVRNGELGHLASNMSAQGLARAMGLALQEEQAFARMGEAARREFETKFSAEQTFKLLCNAYAGNVAA